MDVEEVGVDPFVHIGTMDLSGLDIRRLKWFNARRDAVDQVRETLLEFLSLKRENLSSNTHFQSFSFGMSSLTIVLL